MQSHINIYYTLPIGAEVINTSSNTVNIRITVPKKNLTFHPGA